MKLGLGLALARNSASWWPAGASFAVDFIGSRYMVGGAEVVAASVFSFVRGSGGVANDLAGDSHGFGANELRRTDKGALIEPARQNRILQSQNLNAAAWSRPTTTITDNAISLGDLRLARVLRNAGGQVFSGPAQTLQLANGATYAGSALIKRLDGGVSWFGAYNNTGAAWASGVAIGWGTSGVPTLTAISGVPMQSAPSNIGVETYANGVYRVGFTFTFVGSNTNDLAFQFHANRSSANSSNYAGAFQLEAGAKATSPIITTTAMATREADELTLKLPAGSHDLTVTFDDDSTQTIAAVSGAYAVPTNLNRAQIKGLVAVPH